MLTIGPKDKRARYTQTLTSDSEYPNHKAYWQSITAEIQTFGGHSACNMIRNGRGVHYCKVLTDVCNKMVANYNKNVAIELIEMNLLIKILEDFMAKISDEQLSQFVRDMGMKLTNPTTQLVIMVLQSSISLSGFAAYQLATTILASILPLIGITASFGTYLVLTQAIKVISGLIGWVVSSVVVSL